jgi:hypothetical protein
MSKTGRSRTPTSLHFRLTKRASWNKAPRYLRPLHSPASRPSYGLAVPKQPKRTSDPGSCCRNSCIVMAIGANEGRKLR